ncbi:MAG TPA: hypothetical protein VEU33_10045 [Archangium sp.]|nr:hypothetical protein [Archangium sp.]
MYAMRSWLRLLVLAGLSLVLAGSSCDEHEAVTLEQLRQDVVPPFDYSLYCDEQGRLRAKGSDVLLVHRSAHLEQVYADAQRGEARARTLFGQLETQVAATGGPLADQALGLVCTSLPSCTVRWSFLDELIPSREAGGMRLRHVLAQSFERAARLKGVQNAVLASVLSVLMMGSVLEQAEASAAGAEVRAGATEVGGTTARAAELRAAIPSAQQGRITMGVGLAEDASGAQRVLIGTSEPRGYLRPGVLLKPGETLAPGLGHAEADIVNFTQQNGLRLLEVGATRPICPSCAAVIEGAGAVPVTPLKVP